MFAGMTTQTTPPAERALRETRVVRGACVNIRPMPDRVSIPAFDPATCNLHNQAGRFSGKPEHFRAVATRHDKRDDTFPASVRLAALRLRLRTCESVTRPISGHLPGNIALLFPEGFVTLLEHSSTQH